MEKNLRVKQINSARHKTIKKKTIINCWKQSINSAIQEERNQIEGNRLLVILYQNRVGYKGRRENDCVILFAFNKDDGSFISNL